MPRLEGLTLKDFANILRYRKPVGVHVELFIFMIMYREYLHSKRFALYL